MKLVGYCRVSTDDKGQNPERQADLLRAWVQRENHELVGVVMDEGTSGMRVPPMERVRVQEAIRLANRTDADGIVTEAVDRWTREGPEGYFASRMELRLRHKLVLVHTSMPSGVDGALAEIMPALEAIAARVFWDSLRRQITSGLARAKREGWKNGRPGRQPKPNLTPEEIAYVREMKALGRHGPGWGKMALELTRKRGALEVVDRKAQERRTVKPSWLRSEWGRLQAGSTVRTWRKRPANVARPVGTESPPTGGIEVVAKGGEA